MIVKLIVSKPDDIEVSMTLTGPLGDFKSLNKKLDYTWPSSSLKSAIDKLIDKTEKTFISDKVEIG